MARWRPSDAVITRVANVLRQVTPALNSLDRARVHTELWVSTIRYKEMGGFDIPVEWVTAAAAANLQIVVSILADPDDNDDEVDEGEGEAT